MRKDKAHLFIPLLLTSLVLVYCWAMLLIKGYIPGWKHYTALVLFAVLLMILAKGRIAVFIVALGLYLLLASFHIISLSFQQMAFFFGSDSPYNLHFHGTSVLLFLIYLYFNSNHLFDIELDWKEKRAAKRKQ